MTPAAVGLIVSVLLFLFGVIYQAGRLAARVDALELGRVEMKLDIQAIFAALRRIELSGTKDA